MRREYQLFDTYLYLIGPSGTVIAENDDITAGSDLNSRIPLDGFLTLPTAGTYIIEATTLQLLIPPALTTLG